MGNTSSILKEWYLQNGRNLPWRTTKNPYKIWLSEIILQQTRVDQGMDYYYSFVKRFPNVHSLAAAKLDEVLHLWQGLGYYNRARNLHQTANYISNERNGEFPGSYKSLIKLKGIGAYTAGAIASFCYDEAVPAIDGNVNRFICRYFGIHEAIDSAEGRRAIQSFAEQLVPEKGAGLHNQAIIEFGALQCTPKKPACETCPLQKTCQAFLHDIVHLLPLKSKKTKTRNRYFYYFIIHSKEKLIIEQRDNHDIWASLYQFPLIETKEKISSEKLMKSKEWKNLFKNKTAIIESISPWMKHQLSHQNLFAKFYKVYIPSLDTIDIPGSIRINKNDITNYAIPRLIDKYLEENKI